MNLTKAKLQKIIIEEYIKDTFLGENLSKEKLDQVLAWIRGEEPKPDWLTDDYGSSKASKSGQAPVNSKAIRYDRSADTMPMSSFGNDSEPASVQDQIISLVQDMPAEDMLDLFTAVIEKLAPDYIEPQRRQIGFREIKSMVKEALKDV